MKNSAVIRIILFSVLAVLLCGILITVLVLPKNPAETNPGEQSQMQNPTGGDGEEAMPNKPEKTEPSETTLPSTQPTRPTDPAQPYHSASIPAEAIKEVKVEWVAGSITVQPGDTDEILLEETNNPDRPMVWEIKGGELTVKYADYSLDLADKLSAKNYKKDLIITLPADWQGREVEIDAAAANVKVRDLSLEEVEINCVSGTSELKNCTIREVSMASVSGDIRISGTIEELECNAVTANCTLELEKKPRKIQLASVSGRLDLTLPEDTGFRVRMDGARGKMTSDFELIAGEDEYRYGDGSCFIEIHGVTSRVYIRKAA